MLQNINIDKAWTWYAIHSTTSETGMSQAQQIKTFSA